MISMGEENCQKMGIAIQEERERERSAGAVDYYMYNCVNHSFLDCK
jgi:hypothetical protein